MKRESKFKSKIKLNNRRRSSRFVSPGVSPSKSNNLRNELYVKLTAACTKILLLYTRVKVSSKFRDKYALFVINSLSGGATGFKRMSEVLNFALRNVLRSKMVIDRPTRKVPRFVYELIRKGRKDAYHRAFACSMLRVHKLVYTRPVSDWASITQPFTGSPEGCWDLRSYLPLACELLKLNHKVTWSTPMEPVSWNTSQSAGPNRSPAFMGLASDMEAIKKSMVGVLLLLWVRSGISFHQEPYSFLSRHLSLISKSESKFGFSRKIVVSVSRLVRRWEVMSWPQIQDEILTDLPFRSLERQLSAALAKEKLYHSKLHAISDKGAKTRVVASLDLVTQTLFKPLHRKLFSILKKLRTDGTFDQDKQRYRVRRATRGNSVCYSVDMTSCTDRFPAWFQAWCLEELGVLSRRQSRLWYLGMTCRSFYLLNKRKTKLISVRYRIGQAMGTYSSWSAMALSHHVLVYLSLAISSHTFSAPSRGSPRVSFGSRKWFDRYAILGDDVVIWDDRVGKQYLRLLSILGLEISMRKSYIEKSLAEFGQGLYRYGSDLKPLSPFLLEKGQRNEYWTKAVDLVRNVCKYVSWADTTSYFSPEARLKLTALVATYGCHPRWDLQPSNHAKFIRDVTSLRTTYKQSLGFHQMMTRSWGMDTSSRTVWFEPLGQLYMDGVDACSSLGLFHSFEITLGDTWFCWTSQSPSLEDIPAMVKELVSVTILGLPVSKADKYRRKNVRVRMVYKQAYMATIPDDRRDYHFYWTFLAAM